MVETPPLPSPQKNKVYAHGGSVLKNVSHCDPLWEAPWEHQNAISPCLLSLRKLKEPMATQITITMKHLIFYC